MTEEEEEQEKRAAKYLRAAMGILPSTYCWDPLASLPPHQRYRPLDEIVGFGKRPLSPAPEDAPTHPLRFERRETKSILARYAGLPNSPITPEIAGQIEELLRKQLRKTLEQTYVWTYTETPEPMVTVESLMKTVEELERNMLARKEWQLIELLRATDCPREWYPFAHPTFGDVEFEPARVEQWFLRHPGMSLGEWTDPWGVEQMVLLCEITPERRQQMFETYRARCLGCGDGP